MAEAKIGNGSVVGARSVVMGTIPPYSVYVGNRVIKKRFSEDIIKEIETIDFSPICHHFGDTYEKYCDTEMTVENVKDIRKVF